MHNDILQPIHPGEILLEDFLKPMHITQHRLAEDLNMPVLYIDALVCGKQSITPNMALRLSRYFGLSERFWMNLQTRYDLEVEKDRLYSEIEAQVRPRVTAPVLAYM